MSRHENSWVIELQTLRAIFSRIKPVKSVYLRVSWSEINGPLSTSGAGCLTNRHDNVEDETVNEYFSLKRWEIKTAIDYKTFSLLFHSTILS